MKRWRLLDSEIVLNNKWFCVRKEKAELPDGKIIDDYYIWVSGDFAKVVPITKEKRFVMVRQYKHAAKDFTLEFPAGFVDKKEKPSETAKREMKEETGYTSGEMVHLASMMDNPTKQEGHTHIFLAKDAEKTHDTSFDSNEDIETILLTEEKIMKKIESGEIDVSSSVAAAFLAFRKIRD